jgi:hypothetical protein
MCIFIAGFRIGIPFFRKTKIKAKFQEKGLTQKADMLIEGMYPTRIIVWYKYEH